MAFTESYRVELGSGAEDSITGTVTRHFQGWESSRGTGRSASATPKGSAFEEGCKRRDGTDEWTQVGEQRREEGAGCCSYNGTLH